MTVWEWLQSAKGELAVSGVAGAAVSAITEWEGTLSAVRRLVVGAITAFFLGPALGIPLFSWIFVEMKVPDEHATSVGGFLTGVGGVIIIEIILKALRLKKSTVEVKHDKVDT